MHDVSEKEVKPTVIFVFGAHYHVGDSISCVPNTNTAIRDESAHDMCEWASGMDIDV